MAEWAGRKSSNVKRTLLLGQLNEEMIWRSLTTRGKRKKATLKMVKAVWMKKKPVSSVDREGCGASDKVYWMREMRRGCGCIVGDGRSRLRRMAIQTQQDREKTPYLDER